MDIEHVKKMVDAAFEIGIMSARYNQGLDNEAIANWVRDNLNVILSGSGYQISAPVGMSWGSLRPTR